jgi:hypothetical protein
MQTLYRIIRSSRETHYVSATELNRLMLFGERVAVYCENDMEFTDTVRTSQVTHYVSAAKLDLLILYSCRTVERKTRTKHLPNTSLECHCYPNRPVNIGCFVGYQRADCL